MKVLVFALFAVFGTAFAELPEHLQTLKDKYGSQVTLEEVQNVLRTRCEKNGGAEAFDKLETAGADLQECVQDNFNVTQIKEEIAVKRKTGDLDEVFEKYCGRVPTVKKCVEKASEAVQSCLEEKEREALKLLLNVTDSLSTFACHKDGDRIAMFIAEGGPECIQSRQEDLERCANETFSSKVPDSFDLQNLSLFSSDNTAEACGDFNKLQSCAVKSLEKCDDSTPANIVDALFKFIRRVSPCKDYPNH